MQCVLNAKSMPGCAANQRHNRLFCEGKLVVKFRDRHFGRSITEVDHKTGNFHQIRWPGSHDVPGKPAVTQPLPADRSRCDQRWRRRLPRLSSATKRSTSRFRRSPSATATSPHRKARQQFSVFTSVHGMTRRPLTRQPSGLFELYGRQLTRNRIAYFPGKTEVLRGT